VKTPIDKTLAEKIKFDAQKSGICALTKTFSRDWEVNLEVYTKPATYFQTNQDGLLVIISDKKICLIPQLYHYVST